MLVQLFCQNKRLRGTLSHLADTSGRLLEFRWGMRWEGSTGLKTWSSTSSRCRYGIDSSALGRVFAVADVIMNQCTTQDDNSTILIANMAQESLDVRVCCVFSVPIWSA